MALDKYGEDSEMDGTVFVLQNIPANYDEELIINYVENTLDIDVEEVKVYPFIPGRALVYLKEKLEDFHEAEKKIAAASIESKKIKLLMTSKETAVVVYDLDVQKLSEEFLCLYFECEYAGGSGIINYSRTWPELNMAIVHFNPLKKAVVETVLENYDHIPLPSEDYHISVQPFFHNFHEYIGQQMIHDEQGETVAVFHNEAEEEVTDEDEESKEEEDEENKEEEEDEEEEEEEDEEEEEEEKDEEEEEEDEEEDEEKDEEEEEEDEEEEVLKHVNDFKKEKDKNRRNNISSDNEYESDSDEEGSSDNEDKKVRATRNQTFGKDKREFTLPLQTKSTTLRGGFSGRGVRGKKTGLTESSRNGSYEQVMSSKDSDLGSKGKSGNFRGRGRVQSGFKHASSSHDSYNRTRISDRKSEVNLSQRSVKPRGGSSAFLSSRAKHFHSNFPALSNDRGDVSDNQDHRNHIPRSLSLGQHILKTDMSKQHSTSLSFLPSMDEDLSSYSSQQSRLPEKEINTHVSQSLPQQDPAFKKAHKESQDKFQRDIAVKNAKIKQLEEELSKKVEQSKNCIEKISVTPWQKEFLPHCFGHFDNCRIHFDQHGDLAVLEGKMECVKEHQLKLLKELKKLKEEIWALTPAMHHVLSKEQGKHYLHNLNSPAQLNGAKAFLQDQSLLVVAKDDQTLHEAMEFLKDRMNYKEVTNSAATIPVDNLNSLQSTLEQKYLVKVSWNDNEKDICVEGIKDDVFQASGEVRALIEEFGVHEKSFTVSGAHAKLFCKFFQDQIKQLLEGLETVDFTLTEAQVAVKFKGNKRQANLVHRKLKELETKVTTKSWDLRSEFKKPEELMLITKGFTSEKMKTKVDKFESINKCLVIAKLPSSESFKVKASKKSRLAPSPHQHSDISTSKHARGHFKSVVFKSAETKLILKMTDTCQLIVKPYGDITKESSDVLVCVLAQNVDLRKTRVGQTFNKVCPALWKILKAEHEANPTNPVLTTKGQLYPLKCQAICHIIFTKWNPTTSSTQLSTAIHDVLNQAVALGAKSVSFPVLGCGRAFGFPPSDVAQITFASIKSANLGSTIQKVVLLAPDSELFKEFKAEAPKHFQPASVQIQGAIGGVQTDETDAAGEDEDSLNIEHEDSLNNEDEDSGDDETFVEIISNDLQKSDKAEISIVALHDSGLEKLWSDIKKDIAKVCLHTKYFNQEIADFWPKASRENIIQEAKKLCVWVERSPNPKTKKPGYIIKGEKLQVEKMFNTITKEFNEFSSNLPKNRIKSDKAPKRGTCEFLGHAAKSDELWPSYWKLNSSKKANFFSKVGNFFSGKSGEPTEKKGKLVDVDTKTKDAIKNLVAKTWDPSRVGHGNDAKGLLHSSIKITKVRRIENMQLFESYSMLRKQLFARMFEAKRICPDIGKLQGSAGRVVTTECLEDFMKEELYYEVNEHYLFHGTKCPDAIVENGIDPRVSSEGGMFGKGIYTAEKFTKSDQYTDSRSQRSPPGTTLHMILARVLLGNVYLCDERHKSVANPQSVKLTRPPCVHCREDKCNCKNQFLYDSVMGDGKWIFREFVVYDKNQCYPEYLISYQRV